MTPTRHVPFLAWTLAAVCASAADPPIDFSQDVAPILEKHCLHCHSDNISKGDVSLSTIKSLRKTN
ncbi:MAG: hypothetical protein P8J37_12295, partial [Fuerstiella sp.]|nr:hypothetical protein [Fuerstiella sp.]